MCVCSVYKYTNSVESCKHTGIVDQFESTAKPFFSVSEMCNDRNDQNEWLIKGIFAVQKSHVVWRDGENGG